MLVPRKAASFIFPVLALISFGAFAQNGPQQPTGKTVQQTQASLVQAIHAAEQASRGRARKAEMERENRVDAYEIKIVAKDKSGEVVVDAASGKVLRVNSPGFFDRIANLSIGKTNARTKQHCRSLKPCPMTLGTAIAAAKLEMGGRAVKASLKNQYGQSVFEVAMIKDLVKQKVRSIPPAVKSC